MVRRAVIYALFAGLFVAPEAVAAVPVRGQTLLPGAIYSRQVEFTGHGPVVINVMTGMPAKISGIVTRPPVSRSISLSRWCNVLANSHAPGRDDVTCHIARCNAFAGRTL